MRIVKKETVYLSLAEADTFSEAIRILEGVLRECESPIIKNDAAVLLDALGNFFQNDCDFE